MTKLNKQLARVWNRTGLVHCNIGPANIISQLAGKYTGSYTALIRITILVTPDTANSRINTSIKFV